MTDPARQAVDLLARARREHTPLPPLPDACRPADEAAGYALQSALHDHFAETGFGPQAGHKIGCTTPVMQKFMGIDHPCAGGILADTLRNGEGNFAFADFARPGVECELAVRLGRDLSPKGSAYDRDTVAEAVAQCMAAIEVVDDRYADFKTIGAATLIADDFFNAGCVLGEPVEAWRTLDLSAVHAEMRINGESRGVGDGSMVMGHPFEALAWLANHRVSFGRPLKAGEIVLTGSMIECQWLDDERAAGAEIVIAIGGLGEARATFR